MIEPLPKVQKRPRAAISEERYRKQVREQVIARAASRWRAFEGAMCEVCARGEGTDMHEARFRSQTRNMPPEHRFSTLWCVWCCRTCHEKLQTHKLEVYCRSLVDGCNGLMLFLPRLSTPTSWYTALDVWCHATGRKP